MAVGNTGEYLEQAANAMCTWLSRDGGATWQDVMPYAGIYECAFAHYIECLYMEAASMRLWRGACLVHFNVLTRRPMLGCPQAPQLHAR